MFKKCLIIIIFFLCIGLIISGCPKKTVMKEEPSAKKAEELALEKERAARIEAEKALKEREMKAKEEEAKRARALKELEEERERAARIEAERKKALEELEAKKAQALKELEAEREKVARFEEEKAAREKELARAKEEAAKKHQAEKEKDFEKGLVARKYPGIEGEVFESSLLKDIHFDFDKYDIRPSDSEILKENAVILKKYPNVKIQIEGHCDERGTNEYNLALGERRANSTKEYLISLGISAGRISTISYGEERPLDPAHNEEAWAKNRRAHFIVISK